MVVFFPLFAEIYRRRYPLATIAAITIVMLQWYPAIIIHLMKPLVLIIPHRQLYSLRIHLPLAAIIKCYLPQDPPDLQL